MEALQLIGLGMQFIGGILLSFSLVKSPQQIEDETRGFYGQNPFATVNLLAERRVTRNGLAMIVAGFSFLFSTTLMEMVGAGWLQALLFGVVLLGAGWLLLFLFSVLKDERHRRIHRRYYRSELRNELMRLRDELSEKNRSGRALISWQKNALPDILRYESQVSNELWAEVKESIIKIFEAKPQAKTLRSALNRFLDAHFAEMKETATKESEDKKDDTLGKV